MVGRIDCDVCVYEKYTNTDTLPCMTNLKGVPLSYI